MKTVLLTGGSGFIAAHILDQLLERGHSVVTTVRSEDKAQKIREAHKDKKDRLQVVVIPDITNEDAFDEVIKTKDYDVVMHTASPFHFNFTDPQTEIVDPALIGTTSILKAIKHSAPKVKRVIVTSSFAAILDDDRLTDPNHTFTEKSWNPVTKDDIHRSKPTAYRVSKTLAEKAAWDFIAAENPDFDLVTVNPPLVIGPVVHHFATLDSINTSNGKFVDLLGGKWKDEIPDSPIIPLYIDVRDAALAHVYAMERQEAGGHRLFATAGRYAHRQAIDVVRKEFPEYEDRLPSVDKKGGEALSLDATFKYDNQETLDILNIDWISFEKSTSDLIKSLKSLGILDN